METRLINEIYKWHEQDGTPITFKQAEEKARDVFEYWVDGNLDEILTEGLA